MTDKGSAGSAVRLLLPTGITTPEKMMAGDNQTKKKY
jgi:hypothetical protein